MTVYEVWDWDSMASNWGEPYKEGTYRSKAKADAKAKSLNDAARAYWMSHCSPEGRENYRDQAYVKAVTLR